MKGGLLNRCAKEISGNECEEQKRSIEAVFQPQQPPKFFIYIHVQDARYHLAPYKVAVCKFPQKIHNQVTKYIGTRTIFHPLCACWHNDHKAILAS